MAKKTNIEESMTTQTATVKKGYEDIFRKLDALKGLEKRNFARTLTKEEKKAYVEYLKERDCETITGVFKCFEPAGGCLEMTALAYPGETPVKYTFVDGEEYTIPKYVAKRLESEFQGIGTWYPTHSHILDANGKPTVVTGKKNHRFGFSRGI